MKAEQSTAAQRSCVTTAAEAPAPTPHLAVAHDQVLRRREVERVVAAQRRVGARVVQPHVDKRQQVLAAALVAVQVGGAGAQAQPQRVEARVLHASHAEVCGSRGAATAAVAGVCHTGGPGTEWRRDNAGVRDVGKVAPSAEAQVLEG